MNSFLTELSRRNVFRVAAAYVIVGWIVLQVVSVLMPALHLPGWMPSVAFTILLIGFPVAVLLTWAFEMTPQGVRKIEPGDEGAGASLKLLDLGLLAIAALLVAVTALRPVGNSDEERERSEASLEVAQTAPTPVQAPEASIAVLAFANMSGNPENEYFSDGISEEILNALAGIKSMRVAARTSAFSFKGKNEDVRVIGEALDVANVLEGSVRRSGDRVRITAQLINAADGYHLWSKTYDRELTDVFAIQEEIAQAITEALKVELDIEEKETLSSLGTDNVEAYNYYLRGLKARAATDYGVSVGAAEYFKQAVELDPEFSDAWGALAMGYASSGAAFGFASHENDLLAAISTALRLDPDQPDGLAAKAFYVIMTTYDWKQAGDLYHRALANDSSGAIVDLFISNYLYPLGRNNEAIALYRKTLRRDPLNHGLRRSSAFFNSFNIRDNNFAQEQMDLLAAAGEDAAITPCWKAAILALLGRDEEALENLARARPKVADDPWELYFCAQANFDLGRQGQFDSLFAELKRRGSDQYQYYVAVHVMYGVIGDLDSWLDSITTLKAGNNISGLDARLAENNLGDHVADPRYQKLLRAVRLDDASLAEMGMTWGEQGVAE